jgi:hypothetical protein
MMAPLVDVRFDIEAALSETAWEYPSYGWDWDRELTGSSWGTYQELQIKEAKSVFAEAAIETKQTMTDSTDFIRDEVDYTLGIIQ